jgi:2-dehydro-3-deoxy-D-pentonate aldolase
MMTSTLLSAVSLTTRPTAASFTYRGIIPPLVTPLLAHDQLDVAGLERLVAHLLAGGVHGLFVLGTTGEGPSLSYAVRREMVRHSCRLAAGRVPVLVGITDTSATESLALARYAAEQGADAVVIAPPYYFAPAEPELLHYFQQLTEQLPLPYFLYNMPGLTKVSIGDSVLSWSLGQARCLGLKDSSGNLHYYKRARRLAKARPDYRLLLGPEELLAESLLAGGDGGVSGGANLFPQLYVGIFTAGERGDFREAARLQSRVLEVSERLYRVGKHGSSIIKGIKCALSLRGICADAMAEPYERMNPEDRARVAKILAELDVVVAG